MTDGSGPAARSECQFREERLRCVFVDGHPGAHVCIGPHSSRVVIRGTGQLPEAKYISLTVPAGPAPPSAPGRVSAEEVWGEWTPSMLRELLRELYEAGVSPPRDWMTNFGRLKSSAGKG